MEDIKQRILKEIEDHSDIFIKASPIQYRIRCPLCGDSQKNARDAHCYIKCSFEPSEPLLFNCFLCNTGGRVTKTFLKSLGIDTSKFMDSDFGRFNRIPSIANSDINIITGSPVMNSLQVSYIEHRLGKGFTYEDYDRFKIIWDMEGIKLYVTSKRVRNTMPNNRDSISFISDDKTLMLTRLCTMDEDTDERWKKIRILRPIGRSFYTIKSTFDLFTSEPIYVNIAEGIFDILSAYKNFNNGDNSAYIATLGSDYISGVEYAIAKGLIGSNVILNIYMDSNIDAKMLKGQMKRYKWLFNRISLFQNIKYKDIGTTIDKIKLVEYIV